jgi:hypothetical protein
MSHADCANRFYRSSREKNVKRKKDKSIFFTTSPELVVLPKAMHLDKEGVPRFYWPQYGAKWRTKWVVVCCALRRLVIRG